MAVKIFKGPSSVANSGEFLPEHFEITFPGRVIKLYEENGYDDSDFCALVLGDDDRVTSVQYATTRGWTYANSAEVDATPEVLELARLDVIRRWTERYLEDAELATQKITEGREVRSLTTRGKNKGLAGTVKRIFDGQWGLRALVDGTLPSGERVENWIDIERLELTDTVETIGEDEARREAESRVARQGIYSCYRALSWG